MSSKLGFNSAEPAATGRPAYHPSVLLKIYIYGYLNRTHSSRRLESEAQRNLELIWLTGRLAPDFETIADFCEDNGRLFTEGSWPSMAARQEGHLADRGYFEGYEILKCEQDGIAALVPRPLTSSAAADADRRDFIYDKQRDVCRCPTGQIAVRRSQEGKTQHRYCLVFDGVTWYLLPSKTPISNASPNL